MGVIFGFFGALIGLGLTVIWVLTLIEIVRSEFTDKTERIVWLLIVILMPFLGTILYLMIGRKKRLDTGSDIL